VTSLALAALVALMLLSLLAAIAVLSVEIVVWRSRAAAWKLAATRHYRGRR
jgi:hypothetical protein